MFGRSFGGGHNTFHSSLALDRDSFLESSLNEEVTERQRGPSATRTRGIRRGRQRDSATRDCGGVIRDAIRKQVLGRRLFGRPGFRASRDAFNFGRARGTVASQLRDEENCEDEEMTEGGSTTIRASTEVARDDHTGLRLPQTPAAGVTSSS
ncbi:unnamed protein product, partial [Amoebophrya sp. A25]|eukprot:GSA25T00011555001.1